eukprot:s2513_g6.t4
MAPAVATRRCDLCDTIRPRLGLLRAVEEPQDLFSQLSQAFVSSLREDAPNIFDLRSKISAATRFLRSKLFLVIRKAYGNAWTKLSTPRLQQLKVGEKEAKLLLRRRRERNAAAAILEADLSQAVQNLNLQRFEEKSRFAQQEQMLPEGKLKSLRDQMSLVIVAAQAPIKRLTDTCCRSIDGALNPEVLQALQAELASTRLTTSDIWLQAGLELKLALEALQQLQIHTNEFLSGHGSTASMPSQMPGEGTGQRSRAVATLAKDVAEAKECLGRFERRLSATGREVSPEGIQPLRQFVSKCDARLVDARHDDELYQILQAPPWGHKKRLFAGITEAAWQKLQAAADQATDSARSRMEMSWNEGRQPRLCRTGFLMMWAFPMEEDLLRLLVLVREVGLSQSHKWSSVRLHWLEQCFLNQSFRLMRRVAQCLREGMLVADLGQRQLIFLCFLALCPLRSQDNPRLSIIVMIAEVVQAEVARQLEAAMGDLTAKLQYEKEKTEQARRRGCASNLKDMNNGCRRRLLWRLKLRLA